NVVHNLKCHAEIAAVAANLLFLVRSRTAEDGTESHAHRKQAGCLAIDKVEVLFEGDELTELFHLQQLAFDHLLRELDERVQDAEIAFLNSDFKGLHVKPVAGQNAL